MKKSEQKKIVIRKPFYGNCPRCGHTMLINYGFNICRNCRFIFKSNFKEQ